MTIHKKNISENETNYYFTKTKNKCLLVVYDKKKDYGTYSTSFIELKIEICFNNAFVKKELVAIEINEVPYVILQVLNYFR